MKKYDKEFKLGVLDYVHRHRELTIYECSQHFGVGYSTLSRWLRQERSDKVAECNRLQQELQEARKTLKVLQDAFELIDSSYSKQGS
ncbi:helix-turn-helix domain-containing protein [Selenomonas ruminantium]|uniref:helix-turn-helix domain-containing protein n=1 Tax=Selenomonas ruminantium TaxID=971 RepID=UPI0015685459|nr:helix-turn-helix domain-containing protein [Selenomonas ruminantium]